MKKMVLLFMFWALFTSTAFATTASRTINYQGRLTDLSGNVVPDGVHTIVVRLYDDKNAAENQSKWADTYSVQTKNGYFSVALGSTIAFSDAIDFSRQYWIGIRVDSDSEMTPRQPLNGVPYALNIEVPVGCVLAWHKSFFPSTPTLPSNFVECNGQVISDTESPFNGLTLPNLNGDGRFLRGSATSGTVQDDRFQGHFHAGSNVWVNDGAPGGMQVTPAGDYNHFMQVATFPISDGTNGSPRTASETRPVNMSVVWIMRIK